MAQSKFIWKNCLKLIGTMLKQSIPEMILVKLTIQVENILWMKRNRALPADSTGIWLPE